MKLFLILLLALPAYASDIVVTTGGNAATNGTNFQSSLDAATCGDRVILTAGATYDGTFLLADKSCSMGNEVTITTNEVNMLPMGRVSPSNVAHMAKVRTTGSNGDHPGTFYAASGADWWIIDGLEITENVTEPLTVPALIEFTNTGINNFVVQRNYIHGKDTGTDYERSIRFGLQWEGSGITYQWNYCGPIIGYYPGGHTMIDTNCFISVGGDTITLHDNYCNAWYVCFFMGGGDTAPLNTATVTSSSTTSGTFSNVTGLSAGVVIRFDFSMTGTWTNATNTFTRSSGATMTDADKERRGRLTVGGLTGIYRITETTGADYVTVNDSGNNNIPDGSATFVVYEMAMVDSVAGSVVTYHPFGMRSLQQAPTDANWNYGNQGLVHTVNVTNNTIDFDTDFIADAIANNGSTPKGFFEIKSVADMLVEGNYLQGYPVSLAWTASNQNGTAPWTTVKNVTVRSNWISALTAFIVSDNQYTDTNTPSKNFIITNNYMRGPRNWFQGGNGDGTDGFVLDGFAVTHNTIINDGSLYTGGYNGIIGFLGVTSTFSFNDNIVDYRGNGMMCFVSPFSLATCAPSGEFLNNVAIDTEAVGFNANWWGTGSILTPIPTAYSGVGFVDFNGENFELDVTSDYKGAASDMTDPGVNWDDLMAALAGGSPPPSPPSVERSAVGRVKFRLRRR